MRIRIKQRGLWRNKRIDLNAKIEEIMIRENLLEPTGESISVFLRGKELSGIINLGEEEAERLAASLKNNIKLVKKIKRIKE